MNRLLIVVSLFIISCSSQENLAKRELKKKGFNNITFHKYNECICSNGDIYYIGFNANKDSLEIRGVIWRKHEYKRIYGISLDK